MKKKPVSMIGAGIAIGVGIGVAMDNVGLGIALGLAIGAGMASIQKKKNIYLLKLSNIYLLQFEKLWKKKILIYQALKEQEKQEEFQKVI